jgi:antitoxin component YwqK of YwqJK toxin-antitoxin module
LGDDVGVATSRPAMPTILPLNDLPEPTAFTIKELRESRADGGVVVRQVKQFAGGAAVNHGRYAEQRPGGAKYCEGQCSDGVRVGLWTFWHTSGQVAKTGTYKQGKPEGTWTFFREDGTKERVESYVDGRRDGTWLTYHANGKPARQEEYQAGRRHGTWIEWSPDGKKQVENHLSEDELDGVQMLWHRNGRPSRQMEFKRGRRDGHFISWNEQGEKLNDLVYRNDVLVRSSE